MRFFMDKVWSKFNVIHVTHLSNNLTISSSWIDSGKFPTQRCRLSLTISKVLYPPGSCGCWHDPFTNSLSGSQMVCDEPWICKKLCEKKYFPANETTKCTEYAVRVQEKFIERKRRLKNHANLYEISPALEAELCQIYAGYGLGPLWISLVSDWPALQFVQNDAQPIAASKSINRRLRVWTVITCFLMATFCSLKNLPGSLPGYYFWNIGFSNN